MSSSETRFLPKFRLGIISLVACSAGVLPAACLLGHPRWALWISLPAAAWALVRAKLTRTRTLSWLEWLLELLRSIFEPAMFAVIGIVVWGINHLVAVVLQTLNAPSFIGRIFTLFALLMVAVLGIVIADTWTDDQVKRLQATEGDDAYDGWASVEVAGTAILLVAALAVLGLVYKLGWHTASWVLLQLTVGMFAATLSGGSKGPAIDHAGAVAKLLKAIGYEVKVKPRIGDQELDALLKPLDLYMERGELRYGFGIKAGTGAVKWEDVAALKAATQLYGGPQATAVMVLAGTKLDYAPSDIEGNVQVIDLGGSAIAQALGSDDAKVLSALAAPLAELAAREKVLP